jgi:hypothetical protein
VRFKLAIVGVNLKTRKPCSTKSEDATKKTQLDIGADELLAPSLRFF